MTTTAPAISHDELSPTQLQLATRIVDYFLENPPEEGQRITEEWLSKTFQVSRSPVRSVMRFFAEVGLLSQQGRGFFIPSDFNKKIAQDVDLPEATEDTVYNAIVQDRLKKRIDENISEKYLMREYNISRSQVLRVLNRLSQEGFIEKATGYGWRFLPSLDTPEAIEASYRFRMIVEPAGLHEPTFRLDTRKLEELRDQHVEILESGRPSQTSLAKHIFELNAVFHEGLARMSGNEFILESIKKQNTIRRLNEYYTQNLDRQKRSVQEHIEIIDALLAGEIGWASDLLRHHLRRGAK